MTRKPLTHYSSHPRIQLFVGTNHTVSHGPKLEKACIPEEVEGLYDEAKYEKARQYHSEGGKVGLIASKPCICHDLCFLGFWMVRHSSMQTVSHGLVQVL